MLIYEAVVVSGAFWDETGGFNSAHLVPNYTPLAVNAILSMHEHATAESDHSMVKTTSTAGMLTQGVALN